MNNTKDKSGTMFIEMMENNRVNTATRGGSHEK